LLRSHAVLSGAAGSAGNVPLSELFCNFSVVSSVSAASSVGTVPESAQCCSWISSSVVDNSPSSEGSVPEKSGILCNCSHCSAVNCDTTAPAGKLPANPAFSDNSNQLRCVRLHSSLGMLPDNRQLPNATVDSLLPAAPSSVGIVPLSWFALNSSVVNPVSNPSVVEESVPLMAFHPSFREVSVVNQPSCVVSVPLRLCSSKSISVMQLLALQTSPALPH